MKRSWLLLVLALQVILYWNGLWGGFVFDDRFLIVDTMGQLNLWDIWTTGLWIDKVDQANFYRPIFSTSIWIDQNLFGGWAIGYHWHSLVWHWVNLLLFTQLCQKILPRPQRVIAVLIFATHPLLSEIVFWTAARNDLIALTFMLLFLNSYWKGVQTSSGFPEGVQVLNAKRLSMLGFLFLAAVLSKEVSLILLIPVLASIRKVTGAKYLLAVQLGVVILIFSWRSLIGVSSPEVDGALIGIAVQKTLPFLVDGLGRLGFPWRLSPATSLAWLDIEIPHLMLALGVVFYLVWRMVQDTRNLWWGLWLFGSVAVAFPVVVYTGNTGDRYWTVAVMVWSLLIAQAVPKKWFWIPIPFWMVMIFLRGNAYESDRTFWTVEKQMNPNPYTAVSLAIIDYNEQRYEAALKGFYEGYSADPPHLMGCDSFVSSVLVVNGPEAAIQAHDWILSRGCPNSTALQTLNTILLAKLGQWTKVRSNLELISVESDQRLTVVRLLSDWKADDKAAFCNGIKEVPNQFWSTISAQLKALSPQDFLKLSQTNCVLNRNDEGPSNEGSQ
ncbi:MAG: hypothetical protein ACON4U_08955 [Myxococcota bacterium]